MEFFNRQLLCVCLLVVSWIQESLTCDNHMIQNCAHHNAIGTFSLPDFIPQNQLTEKCKQLKIALDCATQPQKIEGCGADIVSVLVSKRNLRKAICEDRKEEYVSRIACVRADEVQRAIKDCLEELEFTDDYCDAYQDCQKKAREAVLKVTSCGVQDKILVGFLVDQYLKPFIENEEQCDLIVFEDEKTTTSTRATTTAVMSKATKQRKMTMTAMTTTTTTTTENDSVRGAQVTLPVLFLTALATLALQFDSLFD